jgi:hypothetical protein
VSADAPDSVFAGYFAKRIMPRPDWLAVPHIREIWSVSECMSKGPERWIDHWKHNTTTWLFDTAELASSVIPPEERADFVLVAYRFWAPIVDKGEEFDLEDDLPALPPPDDSFESIGFDAVSHPVSNFSCSPLSCNHGAKTFATNEYCLFATLEEAIVGAKEFSTGKWEPGPYFIVEVLRQR